MSNFLAILGAALVVVFGALFAVPQFVDWNQYRGVIEEEASRAVGRDVRIGANVRLSLLPSPSLRLEDVRVADTSAVTGAPIFRTEQVSAKLAIAPLLRGVLEASEIELIKPVVRLVLDGQGGGNWQSFGQTGTGIAYLPSNISLNSILVTDGKVQVIGADGQQERLVIETITGELAAQTLAGPFRFRGVASAGGRVHDTRGQISDADGQGVRRVALTTKAQKGGVQTKLEAALDTKGGLPTLKGDVSVTLPVTMGTGPGAIEAPVEIKSVIGADTRGADLTETTIALENGGRPQVLTGSARLGWTRDLDVSGALDTQWLDLDALAGFKLGADGKPTGGDTPTAVLVRALDRIPDWVLSGSGSGKRAVKFTVAQAGFGGDTVGDVVVRLTGDGDAIRLEDFGATVPGGGRVEASGLIVGNTRAGAGAGAGTASHGLKFNGVAMLRAASMTRLTGWASGGQLALDPQFDGPVALSGDVDAAAAVFNARRVSGSVGGSIVEGEVGYTWGEAPVARIVLSGPVIDARSFQGAGQGGKSAGAKTTALVQLVDQLADGLSEHGRANLALTLKAGRLILSQRTYRDVSMDLQLAGNTLDVRRLDGTADDGASLALNGWFQRAGGGDGAKAATAGSARPISGKLRGAMTAPDAAALKTLFELAGLPDTWRGRLDSVRQGWPMVMAGEADFGHGGAKSAVRVRGDGTAGAIRVRVDGAIDATGADWMAQPSDVSVTLEAAGGAVLDGFVDDVRRALWGKDQSGRGSVSARQKARVEPEADAGRRTLTFRASGVPRDELVVLMRADLGGADGAGFVSFDGKATGIAGVPKLDGWIDVAARDGAQALAIVPAVPAGIVDGVQISGRAHAVIADGRMVLDMLAGKAGDVEVRGDLTLAARIQTADKPAVIEMGGRLALSKLDLMDIVGLAGDVSRAGQAAGKGLAVVAGRSGVWPDRPFDFSLTERVVGKVDLTAQRVDLPDGLSAKNMRAQIVIVPNAIQLQDATAEALGGKWIIAADLKRAPGGAQLTGAVRLEAGKLDGLGGSGDIAGYSTFNGVGVTPASVVAALTGGGVVELGTGTSVSGLSARALKGIVEKALAVGPEQLGPTLRSGLATPAARETIALGGRKLDFDIGNGLVRLKPTQVVSGDGRVLIGGRLDLASLMISSDWQTDAKMPPPPSETIPLPTGITLPPMPKREVKPLPPVIASSSQSLATLGLAGAKRSEQVAVDALERELAVRKVERDLERLERLRMIDEELVKLRAREKAEAEARAKAEAERIAKADVDAQAKAADDAAARIKAAAEAAEATKPVGGLPGLFPPGSVIAPAPPTGVPENTNAQPGTQPQGDNTAGSGDAVPAASPSGSAAAPPAAPGSLPAKPRGLGAAVPVAPAPIPAVRPSPTPSSAPKSQPKPVNSSGGTLTPEQWRKIFPGG